VIPVVDLLVVNCVLKAISGPFSESWSAEVVLFAHEHSYRGVDSSKVDLLGLLLAISLEVFFLIKVKQLEILVS
jgi:hypothetical protein